MSLAAFWRCTLHCFFFNDTATTEIYTLSLHDALPISLPPVVGQSDQRALHRTVARGPGQRTQRLEHRYLEAEGLAVPRDTLVEEFVGEPVELQIELVLLTDETDRAFRDTHLRRHQPRDIE